MLKRFVFFLLILSFVLTACQSNQAATEEKNVQPPDAGKTVIRPEVPQGTPMPDCVAVSINPTPEPTLASLLPPPGPGDWVDGSDTAALTITEYSDFQ